MKNILKLAVVLQIALTIGLVSCGDDEDPIIGTDDIIPVTTEETEYPFTSAIITYEKSGHYDDKTYEGNYTAYIDEGGEKESFIGYTKTIYTNVDPIIDSIHEIAIGFNYIVLDYDLMEYVQADMELGVNNVFSLERIRQSESYMELTNYEKIGQEVVAGKTCNVYSTNEGHYKVWMWKNIVLKEQTINTSIDQNEITVVTSIQENVSVPQTAFEIPDGFTEM